MHLDIFMLLVPGLFWPGSGKDRKVQWQNLRKATTGEAVVFVRFMLKTQGKQVKCKVV